VDFGRLLKHRAGSDALDHVREKTAALAEIP
jgi:hypothetical protein